MLFLFGSCGIQHRFTGGSSTTTDTSFIYTLPYPSGKSYLMIQGYNSRFSHKGRINLDFKMKRGASITAARDGVVVVVEESFTKGGTNKKYLRKANQVIVLHADGTQAMYAHLAHNGALVNKGDTVLAGQVIAKSGSTGYSALSHLHFHVWQTTSTGRKQIPTRFLTRKGPKYLRPGRWYRAP